MENNNSKLRQKFSIILDMFIALFSGGLLCCILFIISINFTNFHSIFKAVSYGPWLEEILKFIVVISLIIFVDLKLIAVPFLGLGFGIVERISYPYMYKMIIIIIPIMAHVLFGIVMAYFIYKAQKNKYSSIKDIWYSLALIIPVFLHLIYNITLAYLAK